MQNSKSAPWTANLLSPLERFKSIYLRATNFLSHHFLNKQTSLLFIFSTSSSSFSFTMSEEHTNQTSLADESSLPMMVPAKSNFQLETDYSKFSFHLRVMIECLEKWTIGYAMTASALVSIRRVIKAYTSIIHTDANSISFLLTDGNRYSLTKSRFATILKLPATTEPVTVSDTDILEFYNGLPHVPPITKLTNLNKKNLPQIWGLCHTAIWLF